jgi:hypothetical protein
MTSAQIVDKIEEFKILLARERKGNPFYKQLTKQISELRKVYESKQPNQDQDKEEVDAKVKEVTDLLTAGLSRERKADIVRNKITELEGENEKITGKIEPLLKPSEYKNQSIIEYDKAEKDSKMKTLKDKRRIQVKVIGRLSNLLYKYEHRYSYALGRRFGSIAQARGGRSRKTKKNRK